MPNAVFTAKAAQSNYDDLIEERYHFPHSYLRQAEQAVGNLIVYYEPRREDSNPAGRKGRQVYFATAQVDRIEKDQKLAGHYYAYVSKYLPFPNPVPFKIGESFFESVLQKPDGSTSKGAFGRSVRAVPDLEFQAILKAGFEQQNISNVKAEEEPPEYGRTLRTVIFERPFREAAFSRVIQSAYDVTCAMTGLRLIDGSKREVEAAHIRPVGENGPDSPRNGIALSRTIHWMFDRGFLSLEDDGKILVADKLVPSELKGLLNADRYIITPSDPLLMPHRKFLYYHREHKFQGN